MRDKGDLDPRLHLSRVKEIFAGPCSRSASGTVWICLLPTQAKSLLGPSLASALPTMGQRSWCGRGKSTLLKGKEPAWAQPSGVLLQQPGIKTHSQLGGDSHEQRGNPISHPAQFQSLHLLLR